ncbi:MAG: recombination protein RecR [Nitrospirae bacterium]|nr:recombination protein RecR [Nitrospirota bacterium]
MYRYPPAVERAIESLTKLPGIGPRTAERMIFFLLKAPKGEIRTLAQAIGDLADKVVPCVTCGNLSAEKRCPICSSPRRDESVICVVGEPNDIVAIEKTSEYQGLYHVLSGTLSPLEGVGPDDLRITELLHRVKAGKVKEVILATNPNSEGEATALYLDQQLKPLGVRVTRIARGIPVGSSLEHVDEVTLAKALEGRREI